MADVESEPLGGDAPFFDSNGGADGAVADTTTARPPSSGLETPKLAKLPSQVGAEPWGTHT